MKKHNLLAIGLMTFAMFLGAGNIIFPPFLGLEAGTQYLPAMLGFLLTAVGLPSLTLIVLGRLSSSAQLTQALPKPLSIAFWVLLFTAIGPAFGMPRAVTVAYEMGIKPFVEGDHLLIFSVLFVGVTLLLAFQRGKLVDYIGKVMTPLLVLMLAALAVAAIVTPLGAFNTPSADYKYKAVTSGLIQGYMTMDAIAAVGFGWIIIKAIQDKGCESPKEIFHATLKVTFVYALLMSACYLAMAYVGATSASISEGATNGGELLTRYVAEIFGPLGQYLLAGIIIMACLTTTVGLTNACAEYYQQTFRSPFAVTAIIVTVLTGVIANFGLEQILAISLPAILILCPIAIALVLTALFVPTTKQNLAAYVAIVCITLVFGSLDALHILGLLPESLATLLNEYVPLFEAHASWFLPVFAAIAISKLLTKKVMNGDAVELSEKAVNLK
ncbi:branched-chain amino acid transport system II carrier protein [Aliivibrio fischeri]|uniref:branched-chain amino acid transport system II carrier protein n=1 Tax=Aliivibrio fischeri TaxID=668 RepID=UPI0007C4C84C|nr:branched-chain amino acid transport system II carrier protein [Aliivibrio fischeri]MCE7534630.1 branched-chain amino acid transport system II carrier protein [Aliivibrio fischeri]MCE7554022.1 branched-chain amino acid transport system II carrier protein [Aliivibrio fischeri]MCE7557534.1 branched-chain amino acid transport system II carrier protein [Aliivibrio fischeri]MCE7561126.1 branched-chain amino acid transport system II carrier protein [Aliivibrio fischeri]MCE7568534.1 branched-chain 